MRNHSKPHLGTAPSYEPIMPRPNLSQRPSRTTEDDEEEEEEEDLNLSSRASFILPTGFTSPAMTRRLHSARTSDLDLRSRLPSRLVLDERASLLTHDDRARTYMSAPSTGVLRPVSKHPSVANIRIPRHHSRAGSWGLRIANALGSARWGDDYGLGESKASLFADERVWYDQFTSTDWVHDSIADNFRVRELMSRKDIRGRLYAWFDGAQGWILVAIIGAVTACLAYFVNVTETSVFHFKEGYCTVGWYFGKKKCCYGEERCPAWRSWAQVLSFTGMEAKWLDFIAYVVFVILFAVAACLLTLMTRTEMSSTFKISTMDENLGADDRRKPEKDVMGAPQPPPKHQKIVYYPAAGSGVAEVKVILSGFVVHGYLGVRTLVVKTLALVLSVSSGLSLGKEGPYVHIATCVGNIACRLFSKYNQNDGKRREVLSASAASGVGVAFGAPIGGVLFSLEEVSYYFPPKTLFRTFFCCIVAALSLKFLNPYGTGKIVIFQVRYTTDWRTFEIIIFIFLGILGGALGALFIKASGVWARTFRRIPIIKRMPLLEVFLVALITGLISFWNRYTRIAVTELLFEIAAPCGNENPTELCPKDRSEVLSIARYLFIAFIIKSFLTTITFGIKVPAGIYVPSMVVGGLIGRTIGHLVQYFAMSFPDSILFSSCSAGEGPESCVVPGVYALVAAGATMCGVTRLSVTLAVILFELTGSLDHVLPFSLSVLVAKWTADAIEPSSIYDLLTDMNSYPLLDNKLRPVFTSELGDITPRVRSHRIIDISTSPFVAATRLRSKLQRLHDAGELDGGLPIIRHGVLVGLIPAPDLEYALDKLVDEENSSCLMATGIPWNSTTTQSTQPHSPTGGQQQQDTDNDNDNDAESGSPTQDPDPTDFTPYIDPAPVALEIHSPMDLVFQCFVKLGLRYICVLRDGQYAGLVHKKAFVKYVKELEKEGEAH